MSECKRCGIDSEELLAKLRATLARLDTVIWEYEMQDHR